MSSADRLDAMIDMVRPFFELRIGPEEATPHFSCNMWELDSLLFTRTSFSAMRFDRTPFHDDGPEGLLLLEAILAGHGRGAADGCEVDARPGSLQLIDLSRPYFKTSNGEALFSVVIPHSVVDYDPARHPGRYDIPTSTQPGRILFAAFEALTARLPFLFRHEAPDLAFQFIELVQAIILGGANSVDTLAVRHARRIAIEAFIEVHLTEPWLTVDHLCAEFGLSRASLYRHFEEMPGPAAFIRQRKMVRACRDLAQGVPHRGAVTEVAARFGFDDAGHFHRLFRKEFGCAPSDCVGTDLQVLGAPEGGRVVHDTVRNWLAATSAAAQPT